VPIRGVCGRFESPRRKLRNSWFARIPGAHKIKMQAPTLADCSGPAIEQAPGRAHAAADRLRSSAVTWHPKQQPKQHLKQQAMRHPTARLPRAVQGALSLAALALLLACAQPAPLPTPLPVLAPAALGLAPATPVEAVAPSWWRELGDARLDALVERALAEQPRLQLAAARLEQARIQARLAGTAGEVQLGLNADATLQRYTAHGLVPPPIAGTWQTSANLMLGASWELDFWGRHGAALALALGSERAARADMAAARTLLAAELARAYIALAQAGSAGELARQTLEQRQAITRLTHERARAGLDTEADVALAEARVAEARGVLLALAERQTLLRHQLAALSAQAPQALDTLAPTLAELKLAAPPAGAAPAGAGGASRFAAGSRVHDVPASDAAGAAIGSGAGADAGVSAAAGPAVVGADLLGRRADLAAARARVEAAAQGVVVARGRFYPDLNLNVFAGLSALGLDKLVDIGSRTYGAGPALRLPLFDQPGLNAQLGSRAADVDAAVAAYNAAVIDAARAAADALALRSSLAGQISQQADALAQADKAWTLARARYDAGLSGYLQVLAADDLRLAHNRAATELRARALDAQVQLMHALGGGWQADEPDHPAGAAASAPAAAPAPAMARPAGMPGQPVAPAVPAAQPVRPAGRTPAAALDSSPILPPSAPRVAALGNTPSTMPSNTPGTTPSTTPGSAPCATLCRRDHA
jgi:outer membrane protein TolC